jgi:hypothetical protein
VTHGKEFLLDDKTLFIYHSEDVISPTDGVTVYNAHPRGQSCVTEASVVNNIPGEKQICFQSRYVSLDFFGIANDKTKKRICTKHIHIF